MDRDVAILEGLEAWRRGDLDGLEQVLDPAVTLQAIEPGPWDCQNRDQVMRLLRARKVDRRSDVAPEIEISRLDDSTFLVSGLGRTGIATVVKVAADKVISMQQISTVAPDPDVERAVAAIRSGDVAELTRILDECPDLSQGPVARYGGRTLLHLTTDWPGYWPNGPDVVRVLVAHGADPNFRAGDNTEGETPLHWAASSDDADVALALLDCGADQEAAGGSIGTPLDNAIGYGCWHVAQLLATRGARVEKLWHAAALGRLDLIDSLLAGVPGVEEISQAFWHACAASQRRAAERLLAAGADLNWIPDYAKGTALDAATGRSTRQEITIEWLSAQSVSQSAGSQ